MAIQIGARCPILGCGGYIAYPLGAIQDRPETKFQGQQELRLRAWRCSEEHDVLERIVDPAKEPDPPNAHAVRASFTPRRRPGGSGRGAARERGDRPVAGGAPCGSTRSPAREANGRVLRAAARGLDGNADRDAGRSRDLRGAAPAIAARLRAAMRSAFVVEDSQPRLEVAAT